MVRLIDADALTDKMRDLYRYAGWANKELHFSLNDLFMNVDGEPTIEAVPVERDIPKAPTDQQLEEDGYGAWGSLYGSCPNCKGTVYDEQNYCEKCGQRLYWGNGDPNGFNDETVQALKDTTERKNLSKVYETLDDMYADMATDCVPIIRCRDCKYLMPITCLGNVVGYVCTRNMDSFEMKPDDYCSRAERIDNER